MTGLWLPTYSPHRNLSARLWQLVQADELCSGHWWSGLADVWALQTGDQRAFGRYQRPPASPA
ncbi:MAG: hypothetical protein M0Z53_03440 [Thermaerobacter sp.]|nr:hypothetical protein [Thermaerobacter sp.]